ncbi:MAG: sulfite exporter TauE/SafE family protein [Gammaproteobacteria bacterium]|nr:sulfite exporter TauE/SafE family protein [Gammaproteobacteria bacterium]MYF01808.1 sulfite exporter TauE/SafE family protein [Gammaproteobacteria bacterium]MYI76448.1 sulfite exporter TauE/SafE family protein [Gammaproteobacteria bacterium]
MDFVAIFIICLVLGASAGLLAGMLGVGGGVIIVPGLIFIFEWLDVFDNPILPSNSLVLFAVGTSMASIIFTTGTAAAVHYRRRTIDWNLVQTWVPCLVLGAIFASLVAQYIPVQYLKSIVASVIFALATIMLLNRLPKVKSATPKKWIPYALTSSGGLVCGLAGLGGGPVMVPSLLTYKTPVAQATATASVGAFFLSMFATTGYMITGFKLSVDYSLGFVYLPALIPIVIMSTIFAPIGVRLGRKLSRILFVRIFGVLMMIVSLRLYYTILFG